jgi:type II secretory pathway pseudopilin PulG
MIVVSIMGILASLALPAHQQFLLRSKRAELPLQLDAIRLSQDAYRAEWDYFTDCALLPTVVGRKAKLFPATEFTSYDWNMVGWVPDGRVYGQYQVLANAMQGQLASFTANAFADIDGDGNLSQFTATTATRSAMLTPTNVY